MILNQCWIPTLLLCFKPLLMYAMHRNPNCRIVGCFGIQFQSNVRLQPNCLSYKPVDFRLQRTMTRTFPVLLTLIAFLLPMNSAHNFWSATFLCSYPSLSPCSKRIICQAGIWTQVPGLQSKVRLFDRFLSPLAHSATGCQVYNDLHFQWMGKKRKNEDLNDLPNSFFAISSKPPTSCTTILCQKF